MDDWSALTDKQCDLSLSVFLTLDELYLSSYVLWLQPLLQTCWGKTNKNKTCLSSCSFFHHLFSFYSYICHCSLCNQPPSSFTPPTLAHVHILFLYFTYLWPLPNYHYLSSHNYFYNANWSFYYAVHLFFVCFFCFFWRTKRNAAETTASLLGQNRL